MVVLYCCPAALGFVSHELREVFKLNSCVVILRVEESLIFLSSFSQPSVSCSLALPSQTLSAMDQLRTHCAKDVSQLERVVGSQQELSAALHQTYPQLVIEYT